MMEVSKSQCSLSNESLNPLFMGLLPSWLTPLPKVSAPPGCQALPGWAPDPLQPSSCLCSCCSGNSELLAILLPSSQLLYLSSMCLDGSSSFKGQLKQHPSVTSVPCVGRACCASVCTVHLPTAAHHVVGELPTYVSESLVSFELHQGRAGVRSL